MYSNESSESYCADLVKQFDPDRYLSTLFAPSEKRAGLFALYAFNLEIARIRESVSEPPLGEIRLQFWRDALGAIYGGQTHEHPVADALAEVVRNSDIPQQALLNLIEARTFDLYDDPMPSVNDLEGYLGETSSILIMLAGRILAGDATTAASDAAGHAGVAYGLTGLLRSVPVHRARGQCYLPKDILEAHQTSPAHILSGRWDGGEQGALSALYEIAQGHLDKAREVRTQVPEAALPAFLPVCLVEGYLKKCMAGNPLEQVETINPVWRLWRLFRAASRKAY